MTFDSADMEGATTIGEILRETRIKRGLDLATVAEETKISPKNLQAMEDGNLASLPAEAYARGFYTLYARLLALDPDEVLAMYRTERKKIPEAAIPATPRPSRSAHDVATLAERPTSLPSSYIGLVIFLFLLFGAFLCWYFGWNPASFLSEKLRSLDGSQRLEQVQIENSGPEFIFDSVVPEAPPPIKSEALSLFSPRSVTAATTQPGEIPEEPVTSAVRPKDIVNAAVAKKTPLQLDNQSQQPFSGKTGETISWQAGQKLIVTLPADSHPRLNMNDIPRKLPKDSNTIPLSIPEDILR